MVKSGGGEREISERMYTYGNMIDRERKKNIEKRLNLAQSITFCSTKSNGKIKDIALEPTHQNRLCLNNIFDHVTEVVYTNEKQQQQQCEKSNKEKLVTKCSNKDIAKGNIVF